MLKQIEAGPLSVAYEEHGPRASPAVVLLHGFPYDVRAYDEVTPLLVAAGCRVVTPNNRGETTISLCKRRPPTPGS